MPPTAPIELRSDVLAPPTETMWAALRRARTGWALVGEDRYVNDLAGLGAELLGKEAALFLPTCSAANLVALMALARPGGTVVADPTSHAATTERAGIGRVAGLSFDGERPGDVLVLENTHNNRGGVALTAAATAEAVKAAGARQAHLDGARLWNAAVALGVSPAELAAPVDTVAASLNKGLCAPYGALLAGPHGVIDRAREAAQQLGLGSIHRAGAFAAAGIVGLTTMRERLAEDHQRATRLAGYLAELPGVRVVPAEPRTNIVLIEVEGAAALVDRLAGRGVRALARDERQVRFVLHRGVDDAQVMRAALAVRALLD